jgi:far upstream element-binding protein
MFRNLSLTGDRRAIDSAKQQITDIVNEVGVIWWRDRDAVLSRLHGSVGSPPLCFFQLQGNAREIDTSMLVTNGEAITHSEVLIPSNRVGMIIGRAGETIKRIQDESGARLQMIQDDPTAEMKPLKIAGDAAAVAKAEKLVRDMLDERDPMFGDQALVAVGGLEMAPLGSSGGPDDENEYRSQVHAAACVSVLPRSLSLATSLSVPLTVCEDVLQPERYVERWSIVVECGSPNQKKVFVWHWIIASQVKEIPVPRWAVGSVIGRAGETIKRIQIDSGARVQFNHDTDMSTDHRICTVSGTSEMVRCGER